MVHLCSEPVHLVILCLPVSALSRSSRRRLRVFDPEDRLGCLGLLFPSIPRHKAAFQRLANPPIFSTCTHVLECVTGAPPQAEWRRATSLAHGCYHIFSSFTSHGSVVGAQRRHLLDRMSSDADENTNESPKHRRLVSGSTFDGEPYQIALEATEVARGASGKIFRGEMVGSPPRMVAVKVIPGLFDPVLEALLARELRTAQAVSTLHPHILPFLGTANVGGRTAIVSTFMDNGNLKQYLKIHHGFSRKKLIVQVAEAVNFLHWTAGLVHGDIKCENVLISSSGDALLADFGLSTFAEKSQAATATMTAIRQMNTLQFAAPELLLGDGPSIPSKNRESDVYAFGMLVLEAISGGLPWPNHSNLSIMRNVCLGNHPARPTLDGLSVSISHLWWKTCQGCWRFSPHDRPPITDVLRSLKATEPAHKRKLPIPEAMMTATYMPVGKAIVAASDQSIIFFNRATGHIRSFRRPGKAGPRRYNSGLTISPDGRYIACFVGESLIVLSAAFGTLVAALQHDAVLSCVAYSRDGTRIASGTHSGSVRLWDAATGAPVGHSLEGDAEDVIDVSFLNDGISLAATSSDGTLRLWNSVTCAPTATLKLSHPGGLICAVAFSSDDTHIVAGNEAGSLVIWDARKGSIVRTFDTRAGAAVSLAFSPSGQYIATGGSHGDIGIWDVERGNRIGAALLGASSFKPAILSVAFSPDGRSLVYTMGGTVREWDLFDWAPGAV